MQTKVDIVEARTSIFVLGLPTSVFFQFTTPACYVSILLYPISMIMSRLTI